MQQLAIEQRRLLGPRAPWHVGDIAWGLHQHEGREHEWTFRLWRDGDRVVAWSWLQGDRGQARARRASPTGTTCSTRSSRSPRRARPSRSRTTPSCARPSRATASCSLPNPMHCLERRAPRAADSAAASARLPLPHGRARRSRRAGRDPPRRLGSLARDGVELRERDGRVAVSRLARLRRRGSRRPLRRVLPHLAGRREPRRRARAGRRARGVPPARPRLGRLHVRAAAAARGGRARGDRLLHQRARLRALPVARLPHPRDPRSSTRDEPPRAGNEPVPAAARRRTRSTGTRGATRRSRERGPRTSRSCSRSATARATGAT